MRVVVLACRSGGALPAQRDFPPRGGQPRGVDARRDDKLTDRQSRLHGARNARSTGQSVGYPLPELRSLADVRSVLRRRAAGSCARPAGRWHDRNGACLNHGHL